MLRLSTERIQKRTEVDPGPWDSEVRYNLLEQADLISHNVLQVASAVLGLRSALWMGLSPFPPLL